MCSSGGMAPKTMSKTQFVLSQPATMSAEEVVAKAKEANLKLAPGYVYNIRSRAKAGKAGAVKAGRAKKRGGRGAAAAKAPAAKPAAKAAAPGRRGRPAGGQTKTAFVLDLPGDLSAAEVV